LALSAGCERVLAQRRRGQGSLFCNRRGSAGQKLHLSYFSDTVINDVVQIAKGNAKVIFETDPLTSREREVLKLIAEGKSSKESPTFFISVFTVITIARALWTN